MRNTIKKKITKGILLFLFMFFSVGVQGQWNEYTRIEDYLRDNPCVSVQFDVEFTGSSLQSSITGLTQYQKYLQGASDFEKSLIKGPYIGALGYEFYEVPVSGSVSLNFDGCGYSNNPPPPAAGFDNSGIFSWNPYSDGSGAYGDIYSGGSGTIGGYSMGIQGNKPLKESEFSSWNTKHISEPYSNFYTIKKKANQIITTSDGKTHVGVLYKYQKDLVPNPFVFYYFKPNSSPTLSTDLYYFFPDKIGDKATTNINTTTTIDNLGINYTYDKTGFPKGQGYYINSSGVATRATISENVSDANLSSFRLPNTNIYNQEFKIECVGGKIFYKTENNIPIFAPIYEQLMYNSYGGMELHHLLWYYKTKINVNSLITDDSNIIHAELKSYLAGNGSLPAVSQEFIDWVVSVTAIQIGAVNNNFEILKAPEFSSAFAEDDDVTKLNSTDPFFTNKPDDPWRLKKYLSPDDTYFIGFVAGLGDGVIETADLAYTLVKFGVKNSPAVLLIRLVTDTDNLIKEKIEEIKVVKDLVALIYDKPKQEQIFNSIKAAVGNWFEEITFQKTNVQAGYEHGKIVFEILGALVGVTEVKTLLSTGKFSASALTKIASTKELFSLGNKIKKIDGVSALVDDVGMLITKGDKAVETFLNAKYMQRGARPDPKTYLDATYITNHLRKFENGVTKITSYNPSGTVGPPGGTFVLPKSQADNLIAQAGGDVNKLEDLLGLKRGDLGTTPYRINIDNPSGLRMPDGNESGANINWIPGGKTSGGIFEATIDQIQPGTYNKHLVF